MKYNKCLLVLSALAAVAFTGCKNDDPDKHHFDNKFYISSALMSETCSSRATLRVTPRPSSRVCRCPPSSPLR